MSPSESLPGSPWLTLAIDTVLAAIVSAVAYGAIENSKLTDPFRSFVRAYFGRFLAIAAPFYVVVERAIARRTKRVEPAMSAAVELVVGGRPLPFHVRPRWRVAAVGGAESVIVLRGMYASRAEAERHAGERAEAEAKPGGASRTRAVVVRRG